MNKTEELNDSIPLQTAKQRIPANTFQKTPITAPLEMINDVQYLIEAPNQEGQLIITPQITTCQNGEVTIFNKCKRS